MYDFTMVTAITEGIKVGVETEYKPDYSSPAQYHYVFTYRITIENSSNYTVQLLRRHWFIHDANGEVKEVEGDGVLGVQPIIEPGENHQYVSGSHLRASVGKMGGYYVVERLIDGKQFKISIPEFTLMASFRLN